MKEKQFAQSLGIPTTTFAEVNCDQIELESLKSFSFPAILKTTTLGYDGKGQYVIENYEQLAQVVDSLKGEYILEAFVQFTSEASVIVARKENGEMSCFPLTINTHRHGILDISTVPAQVEDVIAKHAYEYTKKLAENLKLVGLLAVEYFITQDGKVLFNEMAPRPHNSGHWTMDGCHTSQFEQHIRAICNLPLGSTDIIAPIQMHNLIGDDIHQWPEILRDPKSKLYIYGKKSVKAGRKMGHYNKWTT
jgi:5-(carboxyamino)imidazole ribonucleotide synthase